MDTDSDGDEDNICPICRRSFPTLAGIRQHWTKGHSVSEIQEAIANSSQSQIHSSDLVSTVSQASNTVPVPSDTRPPKTSNPQNASDIVNNRVTCGVCGFLAKNYRGLNIHLRSHNNQSSMGEPQNLPPNFDSDPVDPDNIVQKLGEIIYKCKCSIPLVRIIQKSVRTAVCMELTRVIENVVAKNDLTELYHCFLCCSRHTVVHPPSKLIIADCVSYLHTNTFSRNCMHESSSDSIFLI